jgi:hypothetical protein
MRRARILRGVGNPPRKPEGGYAILSIILIALDRWFSRERFIYTASLRTWLADTAPESVVRLRHTEGEAQP